jgi:biotin-(acetyl-CoA carboxylase) ligase
MPSSRLADIIPSGLDRMARIRRKQGLQGILRRWRAFDQTPGRHYRLEQEGVMLEGVAEGIDDTGALLIRAADGRLLTTRSASSLKELES